MAEAALKQSPNPQLPPKRINLAEFVRSTWRVVAEKEHTKEQILSDEYWAHASQQIKAGDLIEVVNDTEDFFMELYVQQVGRGYAKVALLREFSLSDVVAQPDDDPDYEVAWKGPTLKWCGIRKSDGEKIKEGMEKEEAQEWLKQYLKQI